MSESKSLMVSFCKGRNKLVGLANYLAWKKRIDLALTKHEVMEHGLDEVIEPSKGRTQELPNKIKGN